MVNLTCSLCCGLQAFETFTDCAKDVPQQNLFYKLLYHLTLLGTIISDLVAYDSPKVIFGQNPSYLVTFRSYCNSMKEPRVVSVLVLASSWCLLSLNIPNSLVSTALGHLLDTFKTGDPKIPMKYLYVVTLFSRNQRRTKRALLFRILWFYCWL